MSWTVTINGMDHNIPPNAYEGDYPLEKREKKKFTGIGICHTSYSDSGNIRIFSAD